MAFDPSVFWGALGSPALLQGALLTIALALAVQIASLVIAVPFAAALTSRRRWVRGGLKLYIWLFRGAPMLLILLFVWNGLPQIASVFRDEWFSPFAAAFLAMTLVTVAYASEILRAAYSAVGSGQREAAMALGLSRLHVFVLIVLPQAIRIALPPLVNEFISLLKTTSLSYTISLRELMTITQLSIATSFRVTEWYAAALVYYLAMVSVLMLVQGQVERRFARF